MDPAPNNLIRIPPPNVDFDPGIMESLPYSNMAQAPYPPPVDLIANNLAAMAREMLEALTQAPSLTASIAFCQRSTLRALPEAFQHLSAPLLRKYIYEVTIIHFLRSTWLNRQLHF